jgi:hypothetical protein
MTQKHLPIRSYALFAIIVLVVSGCASRSISNSGLPGDRIVVNPAYRGELTEFDLLGLNDSGTITDEQIAAELAVGQRVSPQIGKPLLVIQSGAYAPDEPMLTALSQSFPVAPFFGIPPKDHTDYSHQLRLAAARGGISQILCYWGVLETAKTSEATKVVSWVPILGSAIPDETQKMRIRLKAVLMDVATGRYRMIISAPDEDARLSASLNRASADQGQVERLKASGYAQLARELVVLGS